MEESKYIVAFEIGSSHIAGAVARIDIPGGDAAMVCCHEMPVLDCVRYGCIVNVDEVYNKIDALMHRIENDPRVRPHVIDSVYIALSCRSLHAQLVTIDRRINEFEPITQAFISQLYDEARQRFDAGEVLEVVPRLYMVDGRQEANPVGSVGTNLHAELNVIVCRPAIRHNLQLVFERLHKRINGYIISPLATALSLFTDDQRQLGQVLVDHGAETTSVSIWQNGMLQYLNVLPLGSRNITRDLCSLSITEDTADKIKRNYGDATSDGKDVKAMEISGVSASDVVGFVTSRAGEIMENVLHQIELANFQTKQFAANGIVYVGRGMNLKHMPELLKSVTGLPVRAGRIPGVSETGELSRFPQLLSVIDAISRKDSVTNCMAMPQMPEYTDPEEKKNQQVEPAMQEEKQQEVEKQPKKKGRIGRFFVKVNTKVSTDLFGLQNDEIDE